MASGTDYIPDRQTDKQSWFDNFNTKAGAIATALTIDATKALTGAADWLTKYETWTAARDTAQGAADELQLQETKTLEPVRAFVRQLKATPGVTPAMLSELRCESPDAKPEDSVGAQKPVLAAALEGGQIVIKFRKYGRQGVLIHSRRPGEADWTLLALDTQSPYVDNRPNLVAGQAETREYRAYFAEKDQAVGEVSDVVSIAVPA